MGLGRYPVGRVFNYKKRQLLGQESRWQEADVRRSVNLIRCEAHGPHYSYCIW